MNGQGPSLRVHGNPNTEQLAMKMFACMISLSIVLHISLSYYDSTKHVISRPLANVEMSLATL